MTLDEFLEALKRTPREWEAKEYGIRRVRISMGGECYHCPLTAVAKDAGCDAVIGMSNWKTAAQFLGIPHKLAKRITIAADGDLHCEREPELLAKLLAACDLPPEPTLGANGEIVERVEGEPTEGSAG